MKVWDYIFETEVIINGDKITIGGVTRENNVYYTGKNDLARIMKEVGPEYFGHDYAVVNTITAELKKTTLKTKEDGNTILWKDTVIRTADDYTVHETAYEKILGTKHLQGTLYLPPDAPVEKIIDFIRNNADVLGGRQANSRTILVEARTPQKIINTKIRLLEKPQLYRAGYLEGVYNIPLTYEEKNLKEIITSLRKPKIKGARKAFGPPAGVPFHAVKSIASTPHIITYTFEDGTKISFTPKKIYIVDGKKIIQTNYKDGIPTVHLVFEAGTASVVDL